jgi:hypothetical protein
MGEIEGVNVRTWHCDDDGTYKGKGCVIVLHLFVVIVFFSMAGNEEVTLNWRHIELTTESDYGHASAIRREWVNKRGLKLVVVMNMHASKI